MRSTVPVSSFLMETRRFCPIPTLCLCGFSPSAARKRCVRTLFLGFALDATNLDWANRWWPTLFSEELWRNYDWSAQQQNEKVMGWCCPDIWNTSWKEMKRTMSLLRDLVDAVAKTQTEPVSAFDDIQSAILCNPTFLLDDPPPDFPPERQVATLHVDGSLALTKTHSLSHLFMSRLLDCVFCYLC